MYELRYFLEKRGFEVCSRLEKLVDVEVLVVNALRIDPHPSHLVVIYVFACQFDKVEVVRISHPSSSIVFVFAIPFFNGFLSRRKYPNAMLRTLDKKNFYKTKLS